MKWNSVWVLTVTGAVTLGVPAFAGALATVESRTGEPATSMAQSSTPSSAPAEDRAALLSMKHLETLKQEIRELRGLVETQDHEIQQLKKSQQDFYTDLDKRVTQLQQPCKCGMSSKAAAKTTVVLPTAKGKSSITIVPTGTTTVPSTVSAEEPVATELPEPTSEKAAYEAAYDLVRTKRYSEATSAFQNYLTQFKDGQHAANAHYWMGEVYMVEWQKDPKNKTLLDKAAHAFSNVTSQFPGNPKVSDALLKLGIIENEKGDATAARKYFTDVKSRYPGSAAARIAETRLKQLST